MKTSIYLTLLLATWNIFVLVVTAKAACQYERSAASRWSKCDPTTHKRKLELRLKTGQPIRCKHTTYKQMECAPLPKGLDAKTAQKKCKYGPLRWLPCDAVKHVKYAVRELKPGSPLYCRPELGVQIPCS